MWNMKSDQLNDKFTLILCFEELLWFSRQNIALQFHIVDFSFIFEISAYSCISSFCFVFTIFRFFFDFEVHVICIMYTIALWIRIMKISFLIFYSCVWHLFSVKREERKKAGKTIPCEIEFASQFCSLFFSFRCSVFRFMFFFSSLRKQFIMLPVAKGTFKIVSQTFRTTRNIVKQEFIIMKYSSEYRTHEKAFSEKLMGNNSQTTPNDQFHFFKLFQYLFGSENIFLVCHGLNDTGQILGYYMRKKLKWRPLHFYFSNHFYMMNDKQFA